MTPLALIDTNPLAEGARPGVAVLEDLDYLHCVSAYWGEINAIVHVIVSRVSETDGADTTQCDFRKYSIFEPVTVRY